MLQEEAEALANGINITPGWAACQLEIQQRMTAMD
jgi:hypothetical protein